MNATKFSLAVATNRTLLGPRFRNQGDKVTVEYDYEGNEGNSISTALIFDEVLDFQYRQVSCCNASDVLGSKEMLCLSESERLTIVLMRWQESVGWQEWQAKQGGFERFKHFKLFFDDVGCIDVIASNFQI